MPNVQKKQKCTKHIMSWQGVSRLNTAGLVREGGHRWERVGGDGQVTAGLGGVAGCASGTGGKSLRQVENGNRQIWRGENVKREIIYRWDEWNFFTADVLTRHSRRSRAESNLVNNGSVPGKVSRGEPRQSRLGVKSARMSESAAAAGVDNGGRERWRYYNGWHDPTGRCSFIFC